MVWSWHGHQVKKKHDYGMTVKEDGMNMSWLPWLILQRNPEANYQINFVN